MNQQNTSADTSLKVAVIGGGIVGSALALALQDTAGVSVQLFESRGTAAQRSGGIMLAQAMLVFDQIGGAELCGAIREKAAALTTIASVSETAELLHVGGADDRAERLLIERSRLLAVLHAHLRPRVLHHDRGVRGVTEKGSGVSVHFEAGGQSEAFDIVVAADGIHSRVGADPALFAPAPTERCGVTILQACTSNAATTNSGGGGGDSKPVAAAISNGAVEYVKSDGTCSLLMDGLRCPDGTTLSSVMVAYKDDADVSFEWQNGPRSAMSREAIVARVRDALAACAVVVTEGGGKEVEVRDYRRMASAAAAIAAHPDAVVRQWGIKRLPVRPAWVSPGGRVVLAGDAAHGMPPFGGQGANQGLEDVRVLARELAALAALAGQKKKARRAGAGNGDDADDVGAALRRYEAERLPAMQRIQDASQASQEVRLLSGPAAVAVRGWCYKYYTLATYVYPVVVAQRRRVLAAAVGTVAVALRQLMLGVAAAERSIVGAWA